MCECLFVAKEASSGKEVFAPKIVVPQGEPARAASKGEDGAAYSLDLLVDKDGKEASFTFTVSRNGDEVQREEGKVEVHR